MEKLLPLDTKLFRPSKTTLQDFIKNLDYVGILFGACWSAESVSFSIFLTTVISEFKKRKCELIYCSSDKGLPEYLNFLEQQAPFLAAIDFEDEVIRASLSEALQPDGVPTLVLIDTKTGKVVNPDCTNSAVRDPELESFPWIPPTFKQVMAKAQFETKEGKRIDYNELVKNRKNLLIQFSANYCTPCHRFAPCFKEAYEHVQKRDPNLIEVLLVIGDPEKEDFDLYRKESIFPVVPFEDSATTGRALNQIFQVQGIPTVVSLRLDPESENGFELLNSRKTTSQIYQDPEGKDAPWKKLPPPLITRFEASEDAVECFVENPVILLQMLDCEKEEEEEEKPQKQKEEASKGDEDENDESEDEEEEEEESAFESQFREACQEFTKTQSAETSTTPFRFMSTRLPAFKPKNEKFDPFKCGRRGAHEMVTIEAGSEQDEPFRCHVCEELYQTGGERKQCPVDGWSSCIKCVESRRKPIPSDLSLWNRIASDVRVDVEKLLKSSNNNNAATASASSSSSSSATNKSKVPYVVKFDLKRKKSQVMSPASLEKSDLLKFFSASF